MLHVILRPRRIARRFYAFLAIVPLLWAALRHNQRDTATAALVLCVFAIWGTLANGGPFARPSLNDSFLLVMMFVISTAVPTLVLSADVAVRRTSEESYRALIDNANDIVATLDLDFRFTSANPAVERILGYAPQEIIGTPLSGYVPEDQLAMHRDMLAQKLKGAASTQYEMQLLGKDRQQRFTLEVNSKLIFDDGKPVAIHSIARDISERKNAEAVQVVLIRELQHRTKNMLAVIQSIVSNTLRRSHDLESAHEALIGRLHALAHAQEFVAAGPGGGVSLHELVEAELSSFGARAIITGETLVLGGGILSRPKRCLIADPSIPAPAGQRPGRLIAPRVRRPCFCAQPLERACADPPYCSRSSVVGIH
jgi:PAS domain S-box-containing protein